MTRQIAVVMCSAVLGLMTLSSHAIAQQKTAKECREEWRANKAANQASGVTEKAYVAQCRGGAAPAQPTAAPSTSRSCSCSDGCSSSTCASANGSRASGQTSSPCSHRRQTRSQHSGGSRRGEPIFNRSTG